MSATRAVQSRAGYDVEAEIEGSNVLALWPTVAEHLQNCDACREDHEGLIALTRRDLGA